MCRNGVESGNSPRFIDVKLRNREEAALEVAEMKLLRLDVWDVKPRRPD